MKFMCSEDNSNNAIRYFAKVQTKMESRFDNYEEENNTMLDNDVRINKFKSKKQKNIKCKTYKG
eukprot:snap_masked-scaffold_24-processed-gene-3.6-mRNA-1 protein AED:1.00 eAED:1.00 QI:0/-1/0/0/-1/1/1/0/63